MTKGKRVAVLMPQKVWDLFEETLNLDAGSPTFDRDLQRDIMKGMKKVIERDETVLTAYLDENGDLQFHGGAVGDFVRDLGRATVRNVKVLRRFFILGEIVREDGLAEPIRVR